MRTASKLLALAFLLALKPACGGGGGGGSQGVVLPSLPKPLVDIPTAVSSGGLSLDSSTITSTINVTGMQDADVQTALQNAINAVSTSVSLTGRIVLTTGGGPRTVVLTSILNVPSNVGNQTTLVLDGSGQITLSGGLTTGILQINDMAQLTVQQIDFKDARAGQSGGAINGLARARQVILIDCSFTNCQTTQTGPDIGGGAIRIPNGDHTQISGCTFTNCAGSNGGAVDSLGTRLTILNSTFVNNAAFGTGGGADAGPSGQGGIGGAVYVDNVSNEAAALHQLKIAGCVFNTNVANDSAGALFGYMTEGTSSLTTIDQTTFAGNLVVGGHGHSGALYSQSDTLNVTNSTFNLNSAASVGGAIFCLNDTSTLTNCTLDANSCGNLGGGIFTTAGNVTLTNVTLAENHASNFSGGLHSTAASTTIQNCVLSANTRGSSDANIQLNGSFTGANNIQAPAGGTLVSGATVASDARLGPLQNNGGPTFTMQPLPASGPNPASPAIDAANPATAPPTDQRGHARNGPPDSGACEGLP